jgi:DNA-binding PadR family transcriptional regulator
MLNPPLSLADQVCLAVIGEGRTHGWAIVKLLAPDRALGRIWSLSRALTYRSIDRLVEFGLIQRSDAGRRAELQITAAGRRQRQRWLTQPVEHLRDLRTEFLLKLVLCDRSSIDTAALVHSQRKQLTPAITALTDRDPGDVVALWRHESAQAAARFLEHLDTA